MNEFNRLQHPIVLAGGAYRHGSGKCCPLTLISHLNGDDKISDYPECSAPALARLVQVLTDSLAGPAPDRMLSPEHSARVLDLALQTIGTNVELPDRLLCFWIADMLNDPVWGVVRFIRATKGGDSVRAIRAVADLCIRVARGEHVNAGECRDAREAVTIASWRESDGDAQPDAAYDAALQAARAAEAARHDSGGQTDCAAYTIDAAVYAENGIIAHFGSAACDFVAWAIARWRELAGLDIRTEMAGIAADLVLMDSVPR